MNASVLPRAVALQYDGGEIIYSANGRAEQRPYSYDGCGLRTFGKSTDFLEDPVFRRAFERGRATGGRKIAHIDDNRWIVHVALWAAAQAARLDGDFVECGVDTGLISTAICDALYFNTLDRDFWLFDTFNGIPEGQMTPAERDGIGGWHNRHSYDECHEQAVRNFAPWPRCRLIRGEVPGTLSQFPADRQIAYLSIDMNIVMPEIAAIEYFWDRLVPGGVVLLDDYAWATHRPQMHAFDAFARGKGVSILALPTGQGIIIR